MGLHRIPNIKIQRTAEVMLSERIEILAAADLGVGWTDTRAAEAHMVGYPNIVRLKTRY